MVHQGRLAGAFAIDEDRRRQGVRRATRYEFRQRIQIQIDGESGYLCDLSVCGCQLLSGSPLRPQQTVRLELPFERAAIACAGKVVWTQTESAAVGSRFVYRAGVQFTNPDKASLEVFIIRHAAL